MHPDMLNPIQEITKLISRNRYFHPYSYLVKFKPPVRKKYYLRSVLHHPLELEFLWNSKCSKRSEELWK